MDNHHHAHCIASWMRHVWLWISRHSFMTTPNLKYHCMQATSHHQSLRQSNGNSRGVTDPAQSTHLQERLGPALGDVSIHADLARVLVGRGEPLLDTGNVDEADRAGAAARRDQLLPTLTWRQTRRHANMRLADTHTWDSQTRTHEIRRHAHMIFADT